MDNYRSAIILIAFFLLFSVFSAQAAEINRNFPPDPAGFNVIDRACATVNNERVIYTLYAVMYNTREGTLVDIYQSSSLNEKLTWKKVYQWKPEMAGERQVLPTPSVLAVFESEEEVSFSIIYTVKYYVGKVTFYLSHDIRTGRFEKGWSD